MGLYWNTLKIFWGIGKGETKWEFKDGTHGYLMTNDKPKKEEKEKQDNDERNKLQ